MVKYVGADDIDNNVQGAEAATEQANRQLAKAAKSQKSGTTLVIIAHADLCYVIFSNITSSVFSPNPRERI